MALQKKRFLERGAPAIVSGTQYKIDGDSITTVRTLKNGLVELKEGQRFEVTETFHLGEILLAENQVVELTQSNRVWMMKYMRGNNPKNRTLPSFKGLRLKAV